MQFDTLPVVLVVLLLPLKASCFGLSCHPTNSFVYRHDDAFRASRSKANLGSSYRAGDEGEGREVIMFRAASRNRDVAFLSAASPWLNHSRRNSAILRSAAQPLHTNLNRIHSATRLGNSAPLLGFERSSHRVRFLHCLAASNDDNVETQGIMGNEDEEQQRGMDEAFATLESLLPEDLVDESSDDREDVPDLKHSRTDDTDASDCGKSTPGEVEHYLDMQGELEGTAAHHVEKDNNILESDIDEMIGDTNEENGILSSNESEKYPWTSINPILRVRGPVASGYGRGGKKLGVPTANLPASLFQSALEDVTNGVYFGWAVIEQPSSNAKGRNIPVKAVVNVGYSPTFEGKENKEKIVEAHLITKRSPMGKPDRVDDGELQIGDDNGDAEIQEDFYNETMRLQLIGYLRPEQKFDSFPDLIAQIHRDIGNAHWALDTMPFILSKEDEFVKDGVGWVGSGGGDEIASWEFESW